MTAPPAVPEPVVQRLLAERYINDDDLAAVPWALDAYPYRYVFVRVVRSFDQIFSAMVPRIFWCVEMLESRGWELVQADLGGPEFGVVLRRAGPTRPA